MMAASIQNYDSTQLEQPFPEYFEEKEHYSSENSIWTS